MTEVKKPSTRAPADAWRADFSVATASGVLAETGHDRWLLWLQIITMLDGMQYFRKRTRAMYARQSAQILSRAAEATGDDGFLGAHDVLENWNGESLTIDAFRRLLWVVEQVEADGAPQSAYAGLRSMRTLAARGTPQIGYIWAQYGRVLRTLGDLSGAERALRASLQVSARYSDRWLKVRSLLGMGVVNHSRGNYPRARKFFEDALHDAAPDVDLMVGSHLGLMSVFRTTSEYDTAIEHGCTALQLANGSPAAEAEALALLSAVSIEVGAYEAAARSAARALAIGGRRNKRCELLRHVVHTALLMGDRESVALHLDSFREAIGGTQNMWERAQSERVLSCVYRDMGDYRAADIHLSESERIASQFGFAEIRWLTDEHRRQPAIRNTNAPLEPSKIKSEDMSRLTDNARELLDLLAGSALS